MNWVSTGSDNGLAPDRHQDIIWTNAGILIAPLETNFSEIGIKIQNFSFMKMHLKMSSGKWRPFCPGGVNGMCLAEGRHVMYLTTTSLYLQVSASLKWKVWQTHTSPVQLNVKNEKAHSYFYSHHSSSTSSVLTIVYFENPRRLSRTIRIYWHQLAPPYPASSYIIYLYMYVAHYTNSKRVIEWTENRELS